MNRVRPVGSEDRPFRPWFPLVLALLAAGCAYDRRPVPHTQPAVLDRHAAAREVEEARRMIQAGDYGPAIPRLLHTISKYPGLESTRDARYWLAVTYYEIGSYRDAIDLFNEYLGMAPAGKYASDSAAYVARLTEEYNQRFLTPEKLNARIETLVNQLRAQPDEVQYQWELADLLWKRGDYEEAGRLYMTLLRKQPDLAEHATVTSRIERLSNREYILLTPQEIQRREIAKKPLEIINVASFRSGEDLLTRESRFYVVTGQVLNRGDSVLYGIKVYVTIYGFGNVVFDAHTVHIGRMNPGEKRAFSARFSNFDNIENIYRHECVTSFQR